MPEELGTSPEELGEEEELITLPNEVEMLERLKAVNDAEPLVERLYPSLLENAGQKRTPESIKLMVALAIYDYVKDLPPVMSRLMNVQLEAFVDALIKKS